MLGPSISKSTFLKTVVFESNFKPKLPLIKAWPPQVNCAAAGSEHSQETAKNTWVAYRLILVPLIVNAITCAKLIAAVLNWGCGKRLLGVQEELASTRETTSCGPRALTEMKTPFMNQAEDDFFICTTAPR